MSTNIFEGLVGQEAPRRTLVHYLEGYQKTRVVPSLILLAPKGTGKTELATRFARGLAQAENSKRLFAINSSTIKSVRVFFEQVVQPHLSQGQHGTLFFDEASELNHSLTTAFLTILNPNELDVNEFSFNGFNYVFDFRRITFLFATTQPQKVHPDLMDRLTKVFLQEYTQSEIGRIILKKLKNVDMDDFLVKEISSTCRANARSAVLMASEIRRYLTNHNRGQFSFNDWDDFKTILNIHPLGLTELELTALKYIGSRELTTLTMLSSKLGMIPETVRCSVELFLLKNDLIEIQPKGRCLTQKGQDYLDNL